MNIEVKLETFSIVYQTRQCLEHVVLSKYRQPIHQLDVNLRSFYTRLGPNVVHAKVQSLATVCLNSIFLSCRMQGVQGWPSNVLD
jgi:hypothetical protein